MQGKYKNLQRAWGGTRYYNMQRPVFTVTCSVDESPMLLPFVRPPGCLTTLMGREGGWRLESGCRREGWWWERGGRGWGSLGLRAAGRGRMVGGLRSRARLINYCFLARSLSVLFASLVIRDNVTTRPLIPTPHFLSFSRCVCVHARVCKPVGALLQK